MERRARVYCALLVAVSSLISGAIGKAYGVTHNLLMPDGTGSGTRCATNLEVQADIELISQVADNVRFYDMNCLEQQDLLWKAATDGKFGMFLGIWMSDNQEDIENQKNNLQTMLQRYPDANIRGIGCGNEVLLAGLLPLDTLLAECAEVAEVIASAGSSIPMAFVEEIDTYFRLPEGDKQRINDQFSIFGFNSHQFFKRGGLDALPPNLVGPEATSAVLQKYNEAVASTDKPIVLTEIGFPSASSAPDAVEYNSASEERQSVVVCDWENDPTASGLQYYFHELRNSEWKLGTLVEDLEDTELNWGLFDATLQPKPVVSQCLSSSFTQPALLAPILSPNRPSGAVAVAGALQPAGSVPAAGAGGGGNKAYGVTHNLLMPDGSGSGTRCASNVEVQADIQLISEVANNVRMYDINCLEQQRLLWQAASNGQFGIMLGIWMSDNQEDIENQKTNLGTLLSEFPNSNIIGLGCGNEVILGGLLPLGKLLEECSAVKDIINASGRSIPMAFVEEIDTYFGLPESDKQSISNLFDFFGFNSHQFFKRGGLDSVPPQQVGPEATAAVLQKYNQAVQETGKEVVLTEVGFPSKASAEDAITYSSSSEARQATVVCDWVSGGQASDIRYFIHELRNSEWKLGTLVEDPEDTELNWGLFDDNLQPKPVVSQCLSNSFTQPAQLAPNRPSGAIAVAGALQPAGSAPVAGANGGGNKAYGVTHNLLMPDGPGAGTRCATNDEVQADIQLISQVANNVRMYDLNCLEQQRLLWQAASNGQFGLMLGIWMSDNQEDIETQKVNLGTLLSEFPNSNIIGLGCGNEVILGGLLPLGKLLEECSAVKDIINASGRSIPMAFVEEIDTYFGLPESDKQSISNLFDFFGFNSHQFFKRGGLDSVPPQQVGPEATAAVLQKYNQAVQETGREVILTEVGFPSDASPEDAITYSSSSEARQATVVCDWVNGGQASDIKYFVHELRNAVWKLGALTQDPQSTELNWGLFSSSLQPKQVVSCLSGSAAQSTGPAIADNVLQSGATPVTQPSLQTLQATNVNAQIAPSVPQQEVAPVAPAPTVVQTPTLNYVIARVPARA